MCVVVFFSSGFRFEKRNWFPKHFLLARSECLTACASAIRAVLCQYGDRLMKFYDLVSHVPRLIIVASGKKQRKEEKKMDGRQVVHATPFKWINRILTFEISLFGEMWNTEKNELMVIICLFLLLHSDWVWNAFDWCSRNYGVYVMLFVSVMMMLMWLLLHSFVISYAIRCE